MDLELTEDQRELQASVRAVLDRECPMRLVRDVVEKGATADALWATMVELGWPALTVPEEHGGLGLGALEAVIVCEELGRAVAPGPFVATATQFVPALREAGSAEQRTAFLGPIAAGELTGALAVDDDADAPVTATPTSSGGWRLDGVKRHVLDGDRADEIVVVVGERAFVAPAAAVDATAIAGLDASRQVATVSFDAVAVSPDRALVGGPDRVARARQEAVVALAGETVGACQSIFDVALEHAKTRVQFGVPIGSFQAIKHKFADMLIALERARATTWFAALTIAEDDDRRAMATAMAKAAAGDCQRLLAQEGIQTMGGIGYTWEHDMHLYVKRAKVGDALLGNGAHHRRQVATLLGL
ncbi:MAG: Acyl-CoA dehydrogenase [Acidimicrobiales bacterium]|jgi:alkylation response protein AidB-like acyl-CoA dehydrogenase|nr:Acyl-CoA dehydrogenase [Acidimicrobiales bacterium]